MKQLKKYNDLDQVGLIINYYSYNHNCYDKNGKYIIVTVYRKIGHNVAPTKKSLCPILIFHFDFRVDGHIYRKYEGKLSLNFLWSSCRFNG